MRNEENRYGKSSAEHLSNPDADESEMLARLSVMVSISTTRRLERLAAYDGVTQREMLERALAGAERQVLEAYGARCRKMTSNGGPLPPITRRAAEAGAGGSAPPVSRAARPRRWPRALP